MNNNDNFKKKKTSKLTSFLSNQFDAWFGDENQTVNQGHVEDTPLNMVGNEFFGNDPTNAKESADGRDSLSNKELPEDRSERYAIFQAMAKDPTLSEGLDMHISHALAPDNRTGSIFHLEATKPEFEEIVKELNKTVIPLINKDIAAWAKTTCIYGVNYVRPYAEEGIGITHFEANYYTLPHYTREYERRGLLAGFTNQHLRESDNAGTVTLAPPWKMIPLKIPFFTPNPNVEPNNYSGKLYSLNDEFRFQSIIETQNYGTSFLENAYVPWRDLSEGLDSLRASRKNASRIDRLITAAVGDLDPTAASDYLYLLGEHLKEAAEEAKEQHRANGTVPTVQTSILPAMEGGKGGVNIDTHSTDPNIQHIEDILFSLKRLAASIGIDVSLLGWADSMSGGLGEGGFFQTAIQAARRAAWIRLAAENFINSACLLHVWYRLKKAVPQGQELPWKVVFNSMNTALEEQENADREARGNFATVVATLVDTIQQGSTGQSPTLSKMLLKGTLDTDEETLKIILTELQKGKSENESDDDMFSSLQELNKLDEPKLIELLLSRLMEMKND